MIAFFFSGIRMSVTQNDNPASVLRLKPNSLMRSRRSIVSFLPSNAWQSAITRADPFWLNA